MGAAGGTGVLADKTRPVAADCGLPEEYGRPGEAPGWV